MPVITGVNFHPVHGSGADHVFEAWSGPRAWTRSPDQILAIKKSATDVSATSPDMLVIAFHFNPLNFNQTYFSGRIWWTRLARCLLLLTY